MPKLTRRAFAAGAAALGPAFSLGQAKAAPSFSYKDWTFDTSELKTDLPKDLVQSFQSQIDIVEGLAIKPEIKAFFRKVPCQIDLKTPGGPGAYSYTKKRMLLSVIPQPAENPVFLHELLHAYHDQRIPRGMQNEKIIGLLKQAKATGHFPPPAYMLSNQGEFFAMCASVVLWGKAARPPSTRETVRKVLPDTYAFIVDEFGFTAAPAAAKAG